MTDKQRFVILGPNLVEQRKGYFHIHREGCADIARTKDLGGGAADAGWVFAAATKREIIEEINVDLIREAVADGADPETAWEDFAAEIWFAPCCKLA